MHVTTLDLVLYVLALACFVAAAASLTVRRINLMALGLALITLAWVIDAIRVHR